MMNHYCRPAVLAILMLVCVLAGHAENKYRFHCEQDTLRITEMLTQLNSQGGTLPQRIIAAARLMEGTPYVAHTLESEPEQVTINVHQMDCIIFAETCFALARASERYGATWRDFADNIENLRYRKGQMTDYASRLHYSADWINDNIYRGNIKEITSTLPESRTITKSLNYMTTHRDAYPALKDSAMFAAIKSVESGFHSLRYPYLPKETASRPQVYENFQDGDMVVILTKEPGLDSSHVTLIRIGDDGKPYMIHAGLNAGKVVFEESPLADYLKYKRRSAPGFRIVRLQE